MLTVFDAIRIELHIQENVTDKMFQFLQKSVKIFMKKANCIINLYKAGLQTFLRFRLCTKFNKVDR